MNNNKLIAEFMGWTEAMDSITHEGDKWWSSPDTHKYHTSWDWLMPVAKKCINPEDNTEGWDNLAIALTTCNIEEVYQAVVWFIQEYNLTPKEVV